MPDQREVVQFASLEHDAERHRGQQGAGELGQEQQPEVKRGVVRRQHVGGQIGRGHRRGCRGQGDDDPGDRNRAGQHAANRQQRMLAAVLVDDQDDDQREPAHQRHERLDIEERVGEQLRGAVEGGHAAGRGEAERQRRPGRVPVGGRGVLEGQHREDERGQGDGGDDPEQRPPAAGAGLDAADRRPKRDCAEDADVHDHRGRADPGQAETDRQRRERPRSSRRLVHRPCSTWPAMNITGFCAAAASTDPSTSSAA